MIWQNKTASSQWKHVHLFCWERDSIKFVMLVGRPTSALELYDLAKQNGITPMEACTLVLLGTGQY
jgi:hypothetical protein